MAFLFRTKHRVDSDESGGPTKCPQAGRSACMYPQTQPVGVATQQQMEFEPKPQHLSDFATGEAYVTAHQYTQTPMKREFLDPSYGNPSQYQVSEGHPKLSFVGPVFGHHGSADLGGQGDTYDALYKQASRAETGPLYGIEKRRKTRTYLHRLPSSSSREETEDPTITLG